MKSHLQGYLLTVLYVTSDFKLKRKQQCIVKSRLLGSYTRYSIMTRPIHRPTRRSAVKLVSIYASPRAHCGGYVNSNPVPFLYTKTFPGTRKYTRRHATLRMNILWEVSESKKRRSYTWPGQCYRYPPSVGKCRRSGVSHGALRLGARNA